jgi:hypothetical protein
VNINVEIPPSGFGNSLMVFFGGPPYLLWIDVVGKAVHHRPVFTARDDQARITDQV